MQTAEDLSKQETETSPEAVPFKELEKEENNYAERLAFVLKESILLFGKENKPNTQLFVSDAINRIENEVFNGKDIRISFDRVWHKAQAILEQKHEQEMKVAKGLIDSLKLRLKVQSQVSIDLKENEVNFKPPAREIPTTTIELANLPKEIAMFLKNTHEEIKAGIAKSQTFNEIVGNEIEVLRTARQKIWAKQEEVKEIAFDKLTPDQERAINDLEIASNQLTETIKKREAA